MQPILKSVVPMSTCRQIETTIMASYQEDTLDEVVLHVPARSGCYNNS